MDGEDVIMPLPSDSEAQQRIAAALEEEARLVGEQTRFELPFQAVTVANALMLRLFEVRVCEDEVSCKGVQKCRNISFPCILYCHACYTLWMRPLMCLTMRAMTVRKWAWEDVAKHGGILLHLYFRCL